MSEIWFFDSCPMSVVMLEWPSKMTNENPHIWIDVYICNVWLDNEPIHHIYNILSRFLWYIIWKVKEGKWEF